MKPLYLQGRDGELGDSQFMDSETVEWIAAQPPIVSDLAGKPVLDDSDLALLKTLVPRRSYFLNADNYDSIHGVRHILRVMVNAILVCRLLGVDCRDHIVAASVHDLRRQNDRRDVGHGQRAAEWLKRHADTLPIHTANIQDMDAVYYSVFYHDTDYEDIPPAIMAKYEGPINILKAADALDRYRQPKTAWWPNMEFIALKEVAELLPVCKWLVIHSERLALAGKEPAAATLLAAEQLLHK